jgi:hypothetical protein
VGFKGNGRRFFHLESEFLEKSLKVNLPLTHGEMLVFFSPVIVKMKLPQVWPKDLNPSIQWRAAESGLMARVQAETSSLESTE